MNDLAYMLIWVWFHNGRDTEAWKDYEKWLDDAEWLNTGYDK